MKSSGEWSILSRIGRAAKWHVRRFLLALLSAVLNHDLLFRLIGRLNRRFHFLNTVFLSYPASPKYAAAYVYEYRLRRMRWSPEVVGIFRQNGKWGVTFASSSGEEMFRDPANRDNMHRMYERMERIREMLGAEYKAFAGILPSVLRSSGVSDICLDPKVTVKAIIQAVEKVIRLEGLPADVPIVVLGGCGYVGSRVIGGLTGHRVYPLDVAGGEKTRQWPEEIRGKPALFVNIASGPALGHYIRMVWSRMVILNEAYPAPSKEIVREVGGTGSPVYHIVGVRAKAWPTFPGPYRGGIPCCAAWPSGDMEVILVRLD